MEINGQEALETSETQQQLANWQAQKKGGGLPQGAAPIEPEQEEEEQLEPQPQVQAQAQEEEEEQQQGESIVIGDQTFTNQQEAWAYAQKLQQDKDLTEARLQGLEEGMQGYSAQAQPQQLVPEPEPEDDFDEEQYYADPKGYLAKRDAKLQERIISQVTQQTTQQQNEQQLWREFFSAHPDLDGFQSDAQAVLNDPDHNKRINLLSRTKGKKAAMDYLAMQTRDKFERYLAARSPKRELPNSRTVTTMSNNAGGAGANGVTRKGNQQQAMDFSTQLRTIRKSR